MILAEPAAAVFRDTLPPPNGIIPSRIFFHHPVTEPIGFSCFNESPFLESLLVIFYGDSGACRGEDKTLDEIKEGDHVGKCFKNHEYAWFAVECG